MNNYTLNTKHYSLNKGAVSVIIAVSILSIMFTIGVGVSTLIIQQFRASSQMGDSVIAFYAAEAGAERCLYQFFCVQDVAPTADCIAEVGAGLDQGCAVSGQITEVLNPSLGISYTAQYNGVDTITSFGEYRSTSRALQLDF